MSLSPVLPIAAASVAPTALRAMRQLVEGLPFADFLQATDRETPANRDDGAMQGGPLDLATGSTALAAQLAQVQRDNEALLQQVEQQLAQYLEAAGVDTQQAIRLQHDVLSGVRTDGSHPQRAHIERALAENPELSRAVSELLNGLQLQQRLEQQKLGEDAVAPGGQLQLQLASGRLSAVSD